MDADGRSRTATEAPERARAGPRRRAEVPGQPDRGKPRASTTVEPSIPAPVAAVATLGLEAWQPFLEAYSGFMLGCIRRLARDYDERMEIYVHVCKRLAADDCRRIKQFRGRSRHGACKFTTWLAAVTFNLGREWIRTHRGRRRLFRAIEKLGGNDRLVFRYHYWEGFEAREIVELLRERHEVILTLDQVDASLKKLRSRLGRDNLWRIVARGARSARHLSLDHSPTGAEGVTPQLAMDGLLPDRECVRRRAIRKLRQAVERLPEKERVALTCRFRHGMTARAVARALGETNYKRVYELQARAISRLTVDLEDDGIGLADFGPVPDAEEVLK